MYIAPRHPPAIAKRIAQRLAAKEHPGMVPANYDLARDPGVRLELLKLSIITSLHRPMTPRERGEHRRRRQDHLKRMTQELEAMLPKGKARRRPQKR
jgi:hypothetical protein